MDAVAELVRKHGSREVERQLADLERHGSSVDDPALWLRTALSHDFKFTPIERVEHCACGSVDHRLLSRFVFWNLLGVRRCEACGLVFVSPRLTKEAIDRIFSDHYFDYEDPEYWGGRRKPVFADAVRLIRQARAHRVFDIGAAYGHFVHFLRGLGMEAAGCELSARAIGWGHRHLGVTLLEGRVEDLDIGRSSFDCAVGLDVLYYVSDPAAHLQAVRRILRPGGALILRLRNNVGIVRRARREGARDVGRTVLPMPHVWGFTPSTASRLLEREGFRVLQWEPAAPSRGALAYLDRVFVALDRVRVRSLAVPPMARSFNLVARRTD